MNEQISRNEKLSVAAASAWTPEQISIMKATVAQNTTDTELAFFLNVAASVGLNPFNKEIWCYKDNKQNLITLTGRDGFLKIAQSDKRWNGLFSCEVREGEEFEIDFKSGNIDIFHKKIPSKNKIIGAYCYISPKGCDIPTIEYVDFDTYNKSQYIWKSHPVAMIKKVAEVNALKKAFGISGLQSEYDFEIKDNLVIPNEKFKDNTKIDDLFEEEAELKTIVKIEKLISEKELPEQKKTELETRLAEGISNIDAEEIIKELESFK